MTFKMSNPTTAGGSVGLGDATDWLADCTPRNTAENREIQGPSIALAEAGHVVAASDPVCDFDPVRVKGQAKPQEIPLDNKPEGPFDAEDHPFGYDESEAAQPDAEPDPQPRKRKEGDKQKPRAQSLWHKRLLKNGRDEPKALLANAIAALRHAPEWDGVLAFNDFAVATTLKRQPPWEAETKGFHFRSWTTRDDVLLVDWLHHQGIGIKISDAHAAVEAVAQENSYHPVREYLNGLKWDGNPRVGQWPTTYLGADGSELNGAIARCFLIGAVARIMEPGCKHDHMLVLEGSQGIGKSRAVKILGGDRFSDDMVDMGTKDAALGLRSVWIKEVSELGAMRRPLVESTKAFVPEAQTTSAHHMGGA
jgi:predicted P-loop ATPase